MSDQHAVAEVEVLQHRGKIVGHGLRSDSLGAQCRPAMAALIKGNHPQAPGQQFVPDEIPLGEAGAVAMDQNHRRPPACHQRMQHGPVGAGDRDPLTLWFGQQPFPGKRVGIALDSAGQGPGTTPADQTAGTG